MMFEFQTIRPIKLWTVRLRQVMILYKWSVCHVEHSVHEFISYNKLIYVQAAHGGLSQWGRSNRPRIRLGTVKSLNALWELS